MLRGVGNPPFVVCRWQCPSASFPSTCTSTHAIWFTDRHGQTRFKSCKPTLSARITDSFATGRGASQQTNQRPSSHQFIHGANPPDAHLQEAGCPLPHRGRCQIPTLGAHGWRKANDPLVKRFLPYHQPGLGAFVRLSCQIKAAASAIHHLSYVEGRNGLLAFTSKCKISRAIRSIDMPNDVRLAGNDQEACRCGGQL